MAVLGCQLRKAEVSKKTYEVASEKLLRFCEVRHLCAFPCVCGDVGSAYCEKNHFVAWQRVHEKLSQPPPPGASRSSGSVPAQVANSLAAEALNVSCAVKALLEVDSK